MDRNKQQTELYTNNSRGSVSVHRNLPRSRSQQSNNYSKNHRGNKHNRHYLYLLAVGINLAFPIQAYAEVGGVSATAAPVANSSGSVTNQAIQVLQGPYITNTYGGGIQCQGPTLNITPYVTGSASATKPYEPYYYDPVYDMRDLDEDGAPDNPGSILYRVPVRTGQKDNYNLGVGFSATWSKPLDKKLQDQCKEAAAANIELMKQTTAKIDCPTPAQQAKEPVGTYIEGFRKKVTEYQLIGKECIQITEKVPLPEQIIAGLPSAGAVMTTGGIAVIATTSALMAKPLADILLKVVKPTVKKVMKKIAKIRGKQPEVLSVRDRQDLQRERSHAIRELRRTLKPKG